MDKLKALMLEFAILDADSDIGDSGLDFGEFDATPYPETVGEVEYELDADGNPILDDYGNPVKKLKAPEGDVPDDTLDPDGANACVCDPQPATVDQLQLEPAVEPEPTGEPEDEFKF